MHAVVVELVAAVGRLRLAHLGRDLVHELVVDPGVVEKEPRVVDVLERQLHAIGQLRVEREAREVELEAPNAELVRVREGIGHAASKSKLVKRACRLNPIASSKSRSGVRNAKPRRRCTRWAARASRPAPGLRLEASPGRLTERQDRAPLRLRGRNCPVLRHRGSRSSASSSLLLPANFSGSISFNTTHCKLNRMNSYKIAHLVKTTAGDPLTPAEAAKRLGVSYQTVKQWIYRKRIRSVRTPGGHHRIPASEIRRLGDATARGEAGPVGMDAISGRNKLLGTVTRIRESGLLAEVTLDVAGQRLTSIITKAAVKQLGLKVGVPGLCARQGDRSHDHPGLRRKAMTRKLLFFISRRRGTASLLGVADPKPEILVFGAASLTESLTDLGKAYESRTGEKVVFSFGASSDLARQIQAGAPADVFFSADTAKMDALAKGGPRQGRATGASSSPTPWSSSSPPTRRSRSRPPRTSRTSRGSPSPIRPRFRPASTPRSG